METQSLLSHPPYSSSCFLRIHRWCSTCCGSLRHLCLPSKAAILILLWTTVVGIIYEGLIAAVALAIDRSHFAYTVGVAITASLPYASLALVMMFYPLSGFVADICCGRYKTVIFSLCMIVLSLLILLVFLLLISFISHRIEEYVPYVIFVSILTLLLYVVGQSGYEANFIQLGLDQLIEAPSEYLGLFIHWSKWVYNALAVTVFILIVVTVICSGGYIESTVATVLFAVTIVCILAFVFLLIFSCCKHQWFYTEPGQNSPYLTVFKVLNYARKHRYPLQRSAFTYCDDAQPSRIDFAKERFGGPFTVEQVEDVKTLFRILLVLVALGPIHVLQVSVSPLIFPLFSLHVGKIIKFDISCRAVWPQLRSVGALMPIISVLFFPVYIWLVFSVFRNKMPRMFTRLGIGIVLFLLGVFSMLVIDLVGHVYATSDMSINGTDTSDSKCMFRITSVEDYYALNIHWTALIIPNALLGIGPLILETTTLEFISAQSPHSMKGLLVGVFFAIKGLFQFLGSVIIIPFSLKHLWGAGHLKEHPSVISCGFSYFLLTCVVGLIGFVLFLVAAKKYKYRERDEVTFRQRDVEEIFDRYLTQTAATSTDYDSLDD